MAAPYKAARPCSKPAAPPDNLSREDSPLGTTTTTKVLARPVAEVLHGGCPPLSRTFGSEALPLAVGSPVLFAVAGADRCTVVVVVVVVVVVLAVKCYFHPCHRCTDPHCPHGTSVAACTFPIVTTTKNSLQK